MNEAANRRAEEVFLEVAATERSDRPGLLAELCGGDGALRLEVESLLRHHDGAEGFLEGSTLREAQSEDTVLPANVRIGSYTVLGVLGSGGMGVVYIAEQQRPRRTVALKVIRRGLASKGMLRRFEHEAEVLGRLQHPGIAQIFEAGVSDWGDGPRPFIAMELIKGRSLIEHVTANDLGTRERLELVVKVCDAVHHAHQRGIIHRDLKPANILVEESAMGSTPDSDIRATPKVLDFGVARAAASDLQVTTLQTGVGQLIGTLPYMSPEQVSQDPSEVDTRTDVYALGVVLYQVISGKLPFDLGNKSVPEAARVIRDDSPARMSSINKVFRGDLETIVSKAIEKDKSRRYQSAAELGADLSRYLAGEPIQARRDSALYIIRKQINRNRGAVAAAILFVAALLGFLVYAVIQAEQRGKLANAAEASKNAALAALAESTEANKRAETAKDEAVTARNEALRSLGEVEAANERADDALTQLRAELVVNNIERGRLYGLVGSLGQAEDLIWRVWIDDPSSTYARWALWELYSRQPCVSTLLGHRAWVHSVAYSPDGARVVSGDTDGEVKVWDVSSGKCVLTLETGKGNAKVVAFSPDGASVAAAGEKGAVMIWRLPKGDEPVGEPTRLGERTSVVWCMAYSAAGDLAAGGINGTVHLWDPTGAPRPVLSMGDKAAVFATAFSPDGALLATGSSDGAVRVFDRATGVCKKTWREHRDAIKSIAFSHDSRLIATGSSDRSIRLWDAGNLGEKAIKTLRAENGALATVCFLGDGKTLISAGWWRVDFWDISTGLRTRSLAGHAADTLGVCVSADGRFLATGAKDMAVRVWEMEPNRSFVRLPGGGSVSGTVLSPDGAMAATAGEDGVIRLWNSATGAKMGELSGHAGEVHNVRFSPTGGMLASGGKDGKLKLWDIQSRACTQTIDAGTSDIFMVRYTADGSKIFTAGRGRAVKIWDAATGALERELEHADGPIGCMVISADGGVVAATPVGKGFTVWNPGMGGQGVNVEVFEAWCLGMSADDKVVGVGTWGGTVDLWDIKSGKHLRTLKVFDQLIGSVAFSWDGSIIAVGCVSGDIKLVDAATGKLLATLEGHAAIVYALEFSRDDSRLVSASDDGTGGVWDLAYYDRHIAGNLEFRIQNMRSRDVSEEHVAALRTWAERVSKRPWPRRGLESGATP